MRGQFDFAGRSYSVQPLTSCRDSRTMNLAGMTETWEHAGDFQKMLKLMALDCF